MLRHVGRGICKKDHLSSGKVQQLVSLRFCSSKLQPFHLAIPVSNLKAAKEFYGGVLSLPEGRSSSKWQDYNLFGHQLVVHEVSTLTDCSLQKVDGEQVPVPHFGVCLNETQFHELSKKLQDKKVHFIIPPTRRFEGTTGEQWTMFFKDPSSNFLEFKAMVNSENLFSKEEYE